MRQFTFIWTVVAMVAAVAVSALADVPTSMSVQGRLTNSSGEPLPPGSKQFTFRILDAESAGTVIWPGASGEKQTVVTDEVGLWTAHIGSVIQLSPAVFEDTARWLEISVDDGANPAVTLPLVKLNTGPFAFRAATADVALALAGGGAYLPLAGGEMTGEITSTGAPSITMGKGSFGTANENSGDWAFVAGRYNEATGDHSTITGGYYHRAEGEYATIGGGVSCFARNFCATVAGGYGADAAGSYSTVSGGMINTASGEGASVGGGGYNRARSDYSVIAGGGGDIAADSNSVKGLYGVISGGRGNAVHADGGTVGGGKDNVVSYRHAVVSGGEGNFAGGYHDVIGGGYMNETADNYSTVAGGNENRALYYGTTICGGIGNVSSGVQSTIGGGGENAAPGNYTFIGGGFANVARRWGSVIGGGRSNQTYGEFSVVGGGGGSGDIDSNVAGGEGSVVPGGRANRADGEFSFAAGLRAKAAHNGSFVWADSTNADFTTTTSNQFIVRASGGTGISTTYIDGSTVLEVADEFEPSFVEMVRFQATNDPTPNTDILTLEAPSTAPDDFQYIECERGSDVKFRVYGSGNVTADGTITGGGADLAELVAVSSGVQSVGPGDVMTIDPENPRTLTRSSTARSTLVAGIYSTSPGFVASKHDWDQVAIDRGLAARAESEGELASPSTLELAAAIGEIPLAVVGIVPCRVSAENGAINPGDLLVTAATAGHAMRDDNPKPGSILGKALGSMPSGTGTIEILVTLQ